MHLQKFAIFNLPNLSFSLIYLHQEPFSVFISFFTFPPGFSSWETTMPNRSRARIFARSRHVFSKLPKNAKSFAKLLERYFLLFLPKLKDANLIWQTVGDGLTKVKIEGMHIYCISPCTCTLFLFLLAIIDQCRSMTSGIRKLLLIWSMMVWSDFDPVAFLGKYRACQTQRAYENEKENWSRVWFKTMKIL